jgi:chromosome segregation ATPase
VTILQREGIPADNNNVAEPGKQMTCLQERDGFETQLQDLQEKIAMLSRELAGRQDDGAKKSTQLHMLRGQLDDLDSANQMLSKAKVALEEKVRILEQELSRESAHSAERNVKINDMQERAGAAERAWKHEKLLLSQVSSSTR